MNTEFKSQNLPQQDHLFMSQPKLPAQHLQRIHLRRTGIHVHCTRWAGGGKGGSGYIMAACFSSSSHPPSHIMTMISTTFESPEAENCSHITEPAVKSSLFRRKLLQMGSQFFEKKKPKPPRRGKEKRLSTRYLASDKPNMPVIFISTCIPQKGGSAHPERPPTNIKWLIYIKH